MSTHIDTIIAEVRNSLKQYDTAGLIDDLSIYNWTFEELKRFGNLIMDLNETVVPIRDGQGKLPNNFNNLKLAIKCDRGWVDSDLGKDELQQTYFWKERTEKTNDWNVCKDCDKQYSEKTIIEKVYFHSKETKFCYKNPTYLKLGKHINRNNFAKDCDNKYVKNSPYEITINKKTIYTNFKEGEVFIRYFGIETDQDGKPYIFDSPLGHLEKYITEYIKLKIFKDIWYNSDDAGIENKISSLQADTSNLFSLALTDVKAASLTLKGLYNLRKESKKRTRVFELPML